MDLFVTVMGLTEFKHAVQVLGSARSAPDDHRLIRDDVQLAAPSALPGRLGQPVGGEQPLRVSAGRHPAAAHLPQPPRRPRPPLAPVAHLPTDAFYLHAERHVLGLGLGSGGGQVAAALVLAAAAFGENCADKIERAEFQLKGISDPISRRELNFLS